MPRRSHPNTGAAARRPAGRNTLRIIGGQWRGRKLQFPDVEGLRPTADRVRETLFNWLQGHVEAEHALDLFAGSGACGLEALSRGAASVVFVDAARQACDSIRSHVQLLAAPTAEVVCASAAQWLASAATTKTQTFGLVFLDPPFASAELAAIVHQLESSGVLKPRAHIYLESGQNLAALSVPSTWVARKNGRAGAVYFGLYQRCA